MRKNNKSLVSPLIFGGIAILGALFFVTLALNPQTPQSTMPLSGPVDVAMETKFDELSKNGNSSCSASFRNSIAAMDDNKMLKGSCCSPMVLSRYTEQVNGLKKYKDIPEIPSDPYDIEAELAKKLAAYYDSIRLTPEQQKAYNYAMEHSMEKGPCCCKCWRWNVYGGLGKYLIQHYNFTGEQVTEIWNFSDGCGGNH